MWNALTVRAQALLMMDEAELVQLRLPLGPRKKVWRKIPAAPRRRAAVSLVVIEVCCTLQPLLACGTLPRRHCFFSLFSRLSPKPLTAVTGLPNENALLESRVH